MRGTGKLFHTLGLSKEGIPFGGDNSYLHNCPPPEYPTRVAPPSTINNRPCTNCRSNQIRDWALRCLKIKKSGRSHGCLHLRLQKQRQRVVREAGLRRLRSLGWVYLWVAEKVGPNFSRRRFMRRSSVLFLFHHSCFCRIPGLLTLFFSLSVYIISLNICYFPLDRALFSMIEE